VPKISAGQEGQNQDQYSNKKCPYPTTLHTWIELVCGLVNALKVPHSIGISNHDRIGSGNHYSIVRRVEYSRRYYAGARFVSARILQLHYAFVKVNE